MINLVPRKEIPLRLTLTTTAVAVGLTLLAGAGIFGILGYDPLAALYQSVSYTHLTLPTVVSV